MVAMGGALTIPGPIDTRMVLNILCFVRLTVAVTRKGRLTPVPDVEMRVRIIPLIRLFVRQRVLNLLWASAPRFVPRVLTTVWATIQGGMPWTCTRKSRTSETPIFEIPVETYRRNGIQQKKTISSNTVVFKRVRGIKATLTRAEPRPTNHDPPPNPQPL